MDLELPKLEVFGVFTPDEVFELIELFVVTISSAEELFVEFILEVLLDFFVDGELFDECLLVTVTIGRIVEDSELDEDALVVVFLVESTCEVELEMELGLRLKDTASVSTVAIKTAKEMIESCIIFILRNTKGDSK